MQQSSNPATRRTRTNFDSPCPTRLSKAPVFRNGRCRAGQLTAMAIQIKRESLLPLDARQARRAARAEAVSLVLVLATAALLLSSCATAARPTGEQKAEMMTPTTTRHAE